MKYNWIDPEKYTMDCFLLFERWAFRWILKDNTFYDGNYISDLAKAFYKYHYLYDFCKAKAPECSAFLERMSKIKFIGLNETEFRNAETRILSFLETFVVYAYPDVMENINYIKDWSAERLYDIVRLEDKVVLDVGAGTGRLAFAAAKKARMVYASEPCDILREYMRDKVNKRGVKNIKVVDGVATCLPYEDNTFDVVMSGHVVGDFYDEEIDEMTRITKDNGWLVMCNGEDEFKRERADNELVSRGFEYFSYESVNGGTIYNYRKRIHK